MLYFTVAINKLKAPMKKLMYPRTMQEAFGPHTSYTLVVESDPLSLSDLSIIAGCVLCAFALAVTLYSWCS